MNIYYAAPRFYQRKDRKIIVIYEDFINFVEEREHYDADNNELLLLNSYNFGTNNPIRTFRGSYAYNMSGGGG